MVNFEKILKQKHVSKAELAKYLDIDAPNVNRIFKKYTKNLSEIENTLQFLHTSLREQFSDEKQLFNNTKVTGGSNVLVGRDNHGTINKLADCEKEVNHLRAIIEEKEKAIADKERTIQILMNK